jgi:aspartate kinase
MKIAKFGGTSLASASQIRKVANIITADDTRRVIVVSAPGKRFKEDIKVTDLLIACAHKKLQAEDVTSELEAVVARYEEIATELNLSGSIVTEIREDLLNRLSAVTLSADSFMDMMKAAGEDNNAKLVACYLQSIGVRAVYIHPRDAGLFVSNEFGNAQILPEAFDKLKENLLNREEIIIFPGFFGYSADGHIVTFSRGGSDITGAILAAALQAKLYENFTDVDSVYVANPQVIEHPKEIKELTYREMRELAYAGFGVFHEEALIPAFRAKIPVCVKNTNNPQLPGTMIVAERDPTFFPVVGIACTDAFSSIFVSKFLMNREIGFGRKLLHILEDEGLSYEHTPSGIDNISVILKSEQLDSETEQRIISRIQHELQVDDVVIEHGIALMMIVGEGMRKSIGVAANATQALASTQVNIEMINQGSSEVSLMIGIKAKDASKAVQAIYQAFFNK